MRRRRSGESVTDPLADPFAALGLPAGAANLSDDDVRAAWRRIATATHPDRDDGGDPARFARAAAAYATLRTSYGRGEALADMRSVPPSLPPRSWLRHAMRLLAAAAVSACAVLAAGWSPGSIGVVAGALTWLVVTRTPGRRPAYRLFPSSRRRAGNRWWQPAR